MKKQIGLITLVIITLLISSLAIGFVKAEQEWKTYENPDYGFRINYPSNWTKKEESGPIIDEKTGEYGSYMWVTFISPKENTSDKGRENLLLRSVKLPPSMAWEPDEYFDNQMKELKEKMPNFNLEECSNITLGGLLAKKIIYTCTMDHDNMKHLLILSIKNKKVVYIVNFIAEVESYDRFIDQANQIIDSFKFI